jgi:hypothetical protein
VRTAYVEKKAHAKAVKRILEVLDPVVRIIDATLPIGAETIVFGPAGELIHLRREGDLQFSACELDDVADATDVVMGWRNENRAAAVQ